MGEMLTLTADDGHRLAAYRAMPAGKPRGGSSWCRRSSA